MKKILFIVLIGLLATSCASTYYYTTLATNNEEVGQVENGDFLVENDDMWIAYSFNGWNAPMQITIFNKSDGNLYVDWMRSLVKLNTETYNYTNSRALSDVFGNPITPTLFDKDGQEILVQGELMKNYVSLIPPQTMISITPYELGELNFDILSDKSFSKIEFTDNENKVKEVGKVTFEKELTPVTLRSYLTLYINEEHPIMLDHAFYIQSIVKAKGISPNKMPEDEIMRGDVFYTISDPNQQVTWRVSGDMYMDF